jgi:hypothetical protein
MGQAMKEGTAFCRLPRLSAAQSIDQSGPDGEIHSLHDASLELTDGWMGPQHCAWHSLQNWSSNQEWNDCPDIRLNAEGCMPE